MLLIKAKDLECDGIAYKSAKRICFQGNSFVRGITFSKRLYQVTDVLYQEEFAADSACLIVDEGTFFTLWRQTNDSDQTATVLTDASSHNTVQAFVQRVAVAKRATLSQPKSSPGTNACRQTPANLPDSQTSTELPKPNERPKCETADSIEPLQPTLLKIEPAQPVPTVPTEPLESISSQDSAQDFLAITTDPFSCPW